MKRSFEDTALNAVLVAVLVALVVSTVVVSRGEAAARRGRELREELSRAEALHLPGPR